VVVDALSGTRLDRRGLLPLPEFTAVEAIVLEQLEQVDPWAAMPAGARAPLRLCPF
jgi:hypothetical protein